MKKFMLLLLIVTIKMSGYAQKSKIVNGGYGAGFSEITWVNGKPSLSLGAYGGWLINHKFLLGAAGNNTFFKQTVNGKKENFQLNFYGLYSEYRIMPGKKVHPSIGVTSALGWQENELTDTKKTGKRDGDFTYVIQPKLSVNIVVTKFMQLQAYGSYRFTGDTKSQYYSRSNYNGASAGASLVFGKF